jgi:hypothetical protein
MASDDTKDVLEQILAHLYAEQAGTAATTSGAYLIAEDGQLLGKLNNDAYDQESILNQYGPFGSQYSNTSIFSKYSPYGSEYGALSIHNPYCTTPPKLYLSDQFFAYVSVNQYVNPRISPEAFLYTISNNMAGAVAGNFIESEGQARQQNKDSFIEAQDGVFLGKLTSNKFDSETIFNRFGPYGNKFAQNTFLNKFSSYGSQFSQLSAYNRMATSPPMIYKDGSFVAYLTKNTKFSPRVDPEEIFDWASRNIS